MRHLFLLSTLVAGFAVGCGAAQAQSVEKHVPEIAAEFQAKYPQGVADSPLCQRGKQQHPPYSRLGVYGLDPRTLESDLSALMQQSDEVVMVGTPLRAVTVLTPSGEEAVTYTDSRILRSWKGSHKVGDVITLEMPQGFLHCGPDRMEFFGTQVGPMPRVGYHTPSHAYSPDGPHLLFLRRSGENSETKALRLTGGGGLQGSFDLVPDQIISETRSPYGSCFLASYDRGWCHAYPHGWSPQWCREPQIDAQNIAQCNAAVRAGKEAIFANGVDQDPVRRQYNGKSVASFLRAVDAATADATHAENVGETKGRE